MTTVKIKSLTWCEYPVNFVSKRYLLPGQAIPLKSGVCLKQALAKYTLSTDKLITNLGPVDDDAVVQNVRYAEAILPYAQTGLFNLIYRGKNYPMVGCNGNLMVQNLPELKHEPLKAMSWATTAGGLLQVEEPHRMWIGIEKDYESKVPSTDVWCPTQNRFVTLQPIDVPICFAMLGDISPNTAAQANIVTNTPYRDKQWWVWNASAMSDESSKILATRDEWLSNKDVIVNVNGKVDVTLEGFDFYSEIDLNFKRLLQKSHIAHKQYARI